MQYTKGMPWCYYVTTGALASSTLGSIADAALSTIAIHEGSQIVPYQTLPGHLSCSDLLGFKDLMQNLNLKELFYNDTLVGTSRGLSYYNDETYVNTDLLYGGLSMTSLDLGLVKTITSYWLANAKPPKSDTLYMLAAGSNGMSFDTVGVGGVPLVRGNYTPEVLSGYDHIIKELGISSPTGGLSILQGPPGTGKTYLIRGILAEAKGVAFVYVPSHLLPHLADPANIPALVSFRSKLKERPIVLLAEDADECLAKRSGSNMSAVSMLLNMGSGVLGDFLKIRVIATTNTPFCDLDEAVTRAGRLSVRIEVGTLDWDTAVGVFKRLRPDDVLEKGEYTLAEVYSKAAEASVWEPAKKKEAMGFRQ